MVDRHAWLLERLAADRRLLTNDIATTLGVSVDTVRRDLRALHDQGLLRRVHGGAVPASPLAPSFSGRASEDAGERDRLADAIVDRLRPGQVIGLDAGTTGASIAAKIPTSLEITIVTNGPAAALALADHPNATVVLLGGEVDLTWMATVGSSVVDALRGYHLDLAVVGVCSFDLEAGATTRSAREVSTKQAMIAAAAETIVAVESAKLGTVAPFAVAPADAVTVVVAGDHVANPTTGGLRRAGVEVQEV